MILVGLISGLKISKLNRVRLLLHGVQIYRMVYIGVLEYTNQQISVVEGKITTTVEKITEVDGKVTGLASRVDQTEKSITSVVGDIGSILIVPASIEEKYIKANRFKRMGQ